VWCPDRDPQVRHRHYLHLARTESVKALEDHLFVERSRLSRRDADDIAAGIRDVVAWVYGEIEAWKGLVDAQTGAPLPWWQARQAAHRQTGQQSEALPAQAVAEYDDEPWPEPPTEGE